MIRAGLFRPTVVFEEGDAHATLTVLFEIPTKHTHTHTLGEWADAAAGSGVFDRDAYLTWVKRE